MAEPDLPPTVWRKSTRSPDGDGNCVEVAVSSERVFLRDSKDQDGPMLVINAEDWATFLAAVKAGTLDLPTPPRPHDPSCSAR